MNPRTRLPPCVHGAARGVDCDLCDSLEYGVAQASEELAAQLAAARELGSRERDADLERSRAILVESVREAGFRAGITAAADFLDSGDFDPTPAVARTKNLAGRDAVLADAARAVRALKPR